MSLQLREAYDPQIQKALKIIRLLESPYSEEGKAAARMLKVQLDKRGTGMPGLGSFKPFFKVDAEFERIVSIADGYWLEMGYIPKPETVVKPEPVVRPEPIDEDTRIREWFAALLDDLSTYLQMVAAESIRQYLDEKGLDLDCFQPYFDPSKFRQACRVLRKIWRDLGIKPKTWRRDASMNPGDAYVWVKGYSYTRKGNTVTVAGYWRLKPGASKIKFKMAE